jgi:hypothetical protein
MKRISRFFLREATPFIQKREGIIHNKREVGRKGKKFQQSISTTKEPERVYMKACKYQRDITRQEHTFS